MDYDAPDGQPVDLLFALIVPPAETSTHLEVLAVLARLFQDPESRRTLRAGKSDRQAYEDLIALVSSQAA